MTQLTPEERERVIDELRAEMSGSLRKELPNRCSGPIRARYRDAEYYQCVRIAKLIRRIRALDQLRAESGLIEKLERLLRAGWDLETSIELEPFTLYGPGLPDRRATGATLTAALKSAPEPER